LLEEKEEEKQPDITRNSGRFAPENMLIVHLQGLPLFASHIKHTCTLQSFLQLIYRDVEGELRPDRQAKFKGATGQIDRQMDRRMEIQKD
jgi:hypothetical protein